MDEQLTIESAMRAVLTNLHTLSEELNQHPKRDIDEISITSEMVNLTIVLRNLHELSGRQINTAVSRAEQLRNMREQDAFTHTLSRPPYDRGFHDAEGKQTGISPEQQ